MDDLVPVTFGVIGMWVFVYLVLYLDQKWIARCEAREKGKKHSLE